MVSLLNPCPVDYEGGHHLAAMQAVGDPTGIVVNYADEDELLRGLGGGEEGTCSWGLPSGLASIAGLPLTRYAVGK